MNSLEHELETSSENEGLRKKQVKLDDQLMEVLFDRCWLYLAIGGRFIAISLNLWIYLQKKSSSEGNWSKLEESIPSNNNNVIFYDQ